MNIRLILGAIVAIIILGVGGFLFMNRSKVSPTGTSSTQTASGSQVKSLKDLMSLTDNQECTFNDADSQSSGTVFGGGGKLRGDFVTNANGTPTNSHIVSDGTNIYIWMDGQTQGFKVSVGAIEDMQNNSMSQSVDLDKKLDYDCGSWTVDSSKFVVPTNVTFTDVGAMLDSNSNSTGTPDTKAAQCAACSSLPVEAQAQCRQALSC